MKSELINVRPDARKESNGCNGTLEREEWRDVVGYEGLYQVSSFGRVRALERTAMNKLGRVYVYPPKIITQHQAENRYPMVVLFRNGERKTKLVHRLVADAFVPNPDNLPQVNHRNEVKTCNYPDNLEYCDAIYNQNYGTCIERRAKKLKGQKRTDEIRARCSENKKEWYQNNPKAKEEFGLRIKKYRAEHPEFLKRLKESQRTKMIPIVQLTLDGQFVREWESLRAVERELNINHDGISRVCKGKRKQSGGFIWKYKSDYENEQG